MTHGSSGHQAGADAGERALFRALFFPILAESLIKNALNTAGVLVLSRFSDSAVAIMGVSNQLTGIALVLFAVLGTAASVVVSQNLGAGNRKAASEATSSVIALLAAMSALFGAVFAIFPEGLLRLMHLQDGLLADGALYLRIVGGLYIFEGMAAGLSAVMRSYGRARHAMYAGMAMSALNALGSWLAVGPPALLSGSWAAGIALVRVAGAAASLAAIVAMMMRLGIWPDLRQVFTALPKFAGNILRIAVPSGVGNFSYNFSQAASMAIISSLGAAAVSSRVYVQSIAMYVCLVGASISSASSIVIGRHIGAGEPEKAYAACFRYLRAAAASNAVCSIAAIALRHQLVGLFTADGGIAAVAATVLILDFFVEIGRALNLGIGGALTAAADVKFQTVVSICSAWGCSILFSYLLGVRAGLGLAGCWIAFGMDELFRGAFLVARWRSRRWQKKSLVADASP